MCVTTKVWDFSGGSLHGFRYTEAAGQRPASLKYMNDPGPCGNEWANQALFDYDGNVLPALEVIRDFRKLRYVKNVA